MGECGDDDVLRCGIMSASSVEEGSEMVDVIGMVTADHSSG